MKECKERGLPPTDLKPAPSTNRILQKPFRLMIGRELEGLSYKELDNLERQLYDGCLAVKESEDMSCVKVEIEEFFADTEMLSYSDFRSFVLGIPKHTDSGCCLSENQEYVDLTCRTFAEMQPT
ncbi:hypothetical protein Tco_1542031 [Tanacetum coccineum]